MLLYEEEFSKLKWKVERVSQSPPKKRKKKYVYYTCSPTAWCVFENPSCSPAPAADPSSGLQAELVEHEGLWAKYLGE
jgi:hypothetical protein